ncbi:MAG: Autoinducer 2 sensor kinase/phosphatase LuxQ [Betaproteobacteria bacterium ADurb.Bin341]|nr:MAG: Autoinducer 2 sensor kinase/phosphatase LuxQ [Betaproteobacteria bacterium ADurb.Bin341]
MGRSVQEASSALAFTLLFACACFPFQSSFALASGRPVRVGVYDNAPKVFVDSRSRPAGFFIELIEEAARLDGWQLEFVVCEWNDCLKKLEAGSIDLMPDVAVSEERLKRFDFNAIPVAQSWSTLLYHPRLPVLTLNDLANKRIAILQSAVQEDVLAQMMASLNLSYQVVYVDSLAKGFESVQQGAAEAVVSNNFFAGRNASSYGLRLSPVIFNPASLQFAVAKGRHADLLTRIDRLLAQWRLDPDSVYYRALNRAMAAPQVEILGVAWKTVIAWSASLLFLLLGGAALAIFSNRQLEQIISKRTAELQTAIERHERTEAELERHRNHLEQIVASRTIELEEAKKAAEAANLAKSGFLASMSHELRTPLNAILGFSQLMARDASIPPAQREQLEIINRSGEHLLAMINDVLDLSKIESGKIAVSSEIVNLRQVCTEVADLMRLRASERGLRLDFILDDGVPAHIRSDATKLRQVLLNLLGNAVKFTKEGDVVLHVRMPKEGQLLIEVHDTGPGISQDLQQAIFEPFVQADNKGNSGGTGLGLAISRRIVEMMGGRIGMTTRVGQGSCFWLELPVEKMEQAEFPEVEAHPRNIAGLLPEQPGWRILVAEDDHDSQLFIQQALRQIGFEVSIACNGQEAVRLFREWHPDLILMDIRMPLLDGIQATRAIRTLPGGETLPIVALTASVFAEDQPQILAAGCNEVLYKPIDIAGLLNGIARHLPVLFRYETPDLPLPGETDRDLIRAEIAALPPALRQSLIASARRLDAEAIEAALAEMAEQSPLLVKYLGLLLRRFDFGRIVEELA